jgi:hypothetical protein
LLGRTHRTLPGGEEEAWIRVIAVERTRLARRSARALESMNEATGDSEMDTRWIASACLLALVLAGCASTPEPGVLVVNDESRVRGCRALGTVADNELDDLQKKAARLGGNVALMTPQRQAKGGYFGLQEYMTADVYFCESIR